MAPPKIEPNSGSSDSTSSGVCEVCKCGKHKVHDGIVCSCLAKKVILIMDSDSEDDSRSPQPDRVSVGRRKNDETTGGRGKHAEASGGKGKHVEQCDSKRRKEEYGEQFRLPDDAELVEDWQVEAFNLFNQK